MKPYLILLAFCISIPAFSQAPELISYQAVVRNANNNLVTNSNIGMQISILQGSSSGSAVYIETQVPISNANGLVSIRIGAGTVVAGSFSSIDWSDGPYFVKTDIDPSGGTVYSITGTTQLLSVPYALHAKTAESISSGGGGHYIGEMFGGGIVFWVSPDGQHGLIASPADLDGGSGVAWSANTSGSVPTARNMSNGSTNTAAIVANNSTAGYAATMCDAYSGGGFNDWYLPSDRELRLLAEQDFVITNFGKEYNAPTNGSYWSSTEYNGSSAWHYNFGRGSSDFDFKNSTFRVRAIRAF